MASIREPSMDNKFIIHLGGGASAGVYSAGVLTGLHNLSLASNVEAIYTVSVGAINAAYFLSGQVELGPTIYWENLQRGFIFPKNILFGTMDLFVNRFVKKLETDEVRHVVDIDHIMQVISEVKPLNCGAILANPTDLFMKVLNTRTGQLRYLKFRDFPTFNLIKAAICINPYYFGSVMIDGDYYIDGTVQEPLGISYLLERYPGRKIIVVSNEPIERGFKYSIKNITEGAVGSLYPYKISLFKLFIRREQLLRANIKLCLDNKNVLLLHPDFSNRALSRTTSPAILKETFYRGISDSEKVRIFLDGE